MVVPSTGALTRAPPPAVFLSLLPITMPKTELSSLAAPTVSLVLKLNLMILIFERASSLVYVEEVDFTRGTVSLCPVWEDEASGPYRKQSWSRDGKDPARYGMSFLFGIEEVAKYLTLGGHSQELLLGAELRVTFRLGYPLVGTITQVDNRSVMLFAGQGRVP